MSQGIQPVTSANPITGATYVGADGFFEPCRSSLVAHDFEIIPLGGSRVHGLAGTSYQDAIDYIDFEIPDADYDGGTWTAEVNLLCENAATTVTPKIRNITDSSDAVVGSAHSSTSWATQSLAFTPTVGKAYRLMLVKSDDVYACWAIGSMQRVS